MFAENDKGKSGEGQRHDSDTREVRHPSDTELPGGDGKSKPLDGEAESEIMNPNRRWRREELYDERFRRRK